MSMKKSGRVRRACERGPDLGRGDDGLGRGGRGDHDVHLGQDGRELLERDRGAAPGPGPAPGRGSTCGWSTYSGSAPWSIRCRAASSLISPAPTSSTGSAVEPVEDLPRQLDRGEGDRDREAADLGLGAHALGRRRRPGSSGRGAPAPRYPHDWASAKASLTWPRICGSPSTMESRLAATRKAWSTASSPVYGVERAARGRASPMPAVAAQPAERGAARLAGHLGHAVDLDPVAGGEDHDLGAGARGPRGRRGSRAACPPRARAARGPRPARSGDSSPRRRGRPGHGSSDPCRPWRKTPAPSVASSTQKPAMAK